ncbi:unnamed protein product [Clavelina lepadiformis]|uniref:Fucosyltransferase n=1 Tax=Clavelina lepadiformis TaxID=159417 RepID=A0ABP0G2J5_CLALP
MSRFKRKLLQILAVLLAFLFVVYLLLYRKLISTKSKSNLAKISQRDKFLAKLVENFRHNARASTTRFHPTDVLQTVASNISESSIENSQRDKISRKRPKILLWKPIPQNLNWTLPRTEMCGFGCDITTNRSEYTNSDAVVLYMISMTPYDLPNSKIRRPDQAFVWWCHESTSTVVEAYYKNLRQYNGYFNWTMHYRKDSNITAAFIPHTARDWYFDRVGRTAEKSLRESKQAITKIQFEKMFRDLMKVKKKSAAWVATDCNYVEGAIIRRQYVNSIEKDGNYSVDIYGGCGNKKLAMRSSVMYDVLRRYKFYLAFENTQFCREYLTEKFWYNSLYAGVVPIVWGPSKATVQEIAPPNSFIHVEDFNYDVKKLTKFLRKLEKNKKAYKEYFKWWMMPGFYPIYKLREAEDPEDRVGESVFQFEVNGFCHLCKMLHEKRHKTTHWAVSDLHQAFYGPEDLRCLY